MRKIMKYTKIFCLLITILLSGSFSFAQKKTPPKPVKEILTITGTSDTQMIFLGSVDGSEYKNSYFGLNMKLPESWIIQEREVNDELKKIGKDSLKGKDKKTQQSLDQAAQKVTILLTATKDIIGIAKNAVLTLAVEKPAPLVRIRNGNDYLRLVLQSYKLMQLPPDFKYSEKIQSEKLGSETFYYIDVERIGYTQRFYATARKGYAVFFLMQFFDKTDLESMKEILRNADFSIKE